MAIQAKMAAPPLPKMGERHEAPPAVEVVVKQTSEGRLIGILTRAQPNLTRRT